MPWINTINPSNFGNIAKSNEWPLPQTSEMTHLSAESVFEVKVEDGRWGLGSDSSL